MILFEWSGEYDYRTVKFWSNWTPLTTSEGIIESGTPAIVTGVAEGSDVTIRASAPGGDTWELVVRFEGENLVVTSFEKL